MGLYLRQLLAGRDFAKQHMFATQMANFVYLIGDDRTRECMVVDPAWDIRGIIDFVEQEEMQLTGALVTHYHPDHVGGEIFGHSIAGLSDLLALRPVKVHVNEAESEGIKVVTGLSDSDLEKHAAGSEVSIGGIKVKCLHTPGHTPGSQCFLVEFVSCIRRHAVHRRVRPRRPSRWRPRADVSFAHAGAFKTPGSDGAFPRT